MNPLKIIWIYLNILAKHLLFKIKLSYNDVNGTSCDNCFTGYRPGQLIYCDDCGSEFCNSCIKNHKH